MTPVFIVTIVIVASLILVKMVLDYNRARMIDDRSSESERSLPASELTALIRESVAEEVRPLAEKLERLENRQTGEGERGIEVDDRIEGGTEADRVTRPSRQR